MRHIMLSVLAAFLPLGVGACEDRQAPPVPSPDGRPAARVPPPSAQPAEPSDDEIVDEIRRLVKEDKSLSTAAQQCDIAVVRGVVTLSGAVDTRAESVSIENKASSVAGVVRVENALVPKSGG